MVPIRSLQSFSHVVQISGICTGFLGIFFEDEVAFKRICGLSAIILKWQYKLHK